MNLQSKLNNTEITEDAASFEFNEGRKISGRKKQMWSEKIKEDKTYIAAITGKEIQTSDDQRAIKKILKTSKIFQMKITATEKLLGNV